MTTAMQDDLFDRADAQASRDEAMERVTANAGNWSIRARIRVRALPAGWTGTGEDMRFEFTAAGFDQPHSPNAWGALTGYCVKQGWLELTGERRKMRGPKSNARKTDVYRRTVL